MIYDLNLSLFSSGWIKTKHKNVLDGEGCGVNVHVLLYNHVSREGILFSFT